MKMGMRQFHFVLFFSYVFTGCKPSNPSEVKFETGAAHKRGHEDITRYGVERANAELKNVLGIESFFPVPAKGVAGVDTGNKIVRGNFETDFPEKEFLDFYQSRSRLPLLRWLDWHESPTLQHLHGLRNRPNGPFQDQFTTCRETTDAIATALNQALQHLRQDRNAEKGRFWLGHATHIVQDTFSKAHTVRGGEGLKTLVDHCTYGTRDPAICFHEENDDRDDVWKNDGGKCEFDPNNRNWACLRGEAQAAAQATAGLLVLAGRLAVAKDLNIDAEARQWLRGSPGLHESGYFDCSPMGLTLLGNYFNFIAGKALPAAEQDSLRTKLETSSLESLKSSLLEKYAQQIFSELTGVSLDPELLSRYKPYLNSNGLTKTADKIFIEDANELVAKRFRTATGKEVDPIWLPHYTSFLISKRSLAELDAEIKRQTTTPAANQPLDACGNLPTPQEILKCRSRQG